MSALSQFHDLLEPITWAFIANVGVILCATVAIGILLRMHPKAEIPEAWRVSPEPESRVRAFRANQKSGPKGCKAGFQSGDRVVPLRRTR